MRMSPDYFIYILRINFFLDNRVTVRKSLSYDRLTFRGNDEMRYSFIGTKMNGCYSENMIFKKIK
jgi:hypothetical protein